MNYCEQMKQAIKEEMERVFGEINDCGCYKHNGQWFSTESVLNVVFDAIDNNDYLFLED